MSRLCPAAIAATATPSSSGTANEAETKAAKNAGESFRIVVSCNDSAAGNILRINPRQEKELSMP